MTDIPPRAHVLEVPTGRAAQPTSCSFSPALQIPANTFTGAYFKPGAKGVEALSI
jgi:hypothetical protein